MPIFSNSAVADIRATLQAFQDGYTHRDLATIDAFMELFSSEATLEVIGTSAVSTAVDEWCIGRPSVRALVEADWQFWGDLKLDLTEARIHLRDSVAWLATTGTVTQTIPLTQTYSNITHYLSQAIEQRNNMNSDRNVESELLLVIQGAASALANAHKGEHYVWPMRFTATLVQEQEHWLFHQIHFSYATIHDPDVRVT
jgi:hypothetical protein